MLGNVNLMTRVHQINRNGTAIQKTKKRYSLEPIVLEKLIKSFLFIKLI